MKRKNQYILQKMAIDLKILGPAQSELEEIARIHYDDY